MQVIVESLYEYHVYSLHIHDLFYCEVSVSDRLDFDLHSVPPSL